VTVGVITGEDVAQAFQTIRKAGTVVITSLGSHNSTEGLPINPQEITLMQKRIQGALFGMCNPVSDIPGRFRCTRMGNSSSMN
jgi:Zn-dependent alcohol dehydrogenase